MKKLNYSQKMSLTAGTAALLAPAISQAALSYFDNTNAITVSYSGTTLAEWDVDGGGESDFSLYDWSSRYIFLSSFQRSARGVVRTGTIGTRWYAINNLTSGFVVGATLTGAYNWGTTTEYWAMLSGSKVGYVFKNASIGSNFIGFKFNIGADLHYGWAEIILSADAVTINQWAYDDTADTAITVGDTIGTPAPVSEPASLALLALGAAGIARMRRRQALVVA